MLIKNHLIGLDHPPYIIAELSANHDGDLKQELKLIDAAQEAGADADKIQTYPPDTITLKSDAPDFQITEGLWAGPHLLTAMNGLIRRRSRTTRCSLMPPNAGITLFSSPFDPTAVDLLEGLSAPAYKIASFEAFDLPLIRYRASKGKPVIISTEMADLEEITETAEATRDGGCAELALLYCMSGYLAPAADYCLASIADMAAGFKVPVGLSDHTLDNTTAIASVPPGHALSRKTKHWNPQRPQSCVRVRAPRGRPWEAWITGAIRASRGICNSGAHCIL